MGKHTENDDGSGTFEGDLEEYEGKHRKEKK
jgi:hypothetical protein